MFTKLFAVLVGLVLALGLAGSASAQARYPAAPPGASVSSTAVGPGGTVTFFAGGFGRGTTVTVTVRRVDGEAAGGLDVVASGGSRLGAGFVVVQAKGWTGFSTTAVADSAGTIEVPVKLGPAGSYEIVASGVDADGNPVSVSSTVLVSADAGKSGSGSDSNSGSGAAGSGSNGSSSAAGGTLARTGVDNVATIAWAAFGVLVLGGLLVAVASGRGRTRETV